MSRCRTAWFGVVLIAVLAAPASAPATGARTDGTILLRLGDSVVVAGTPIQCFALSSSGKNGIGCLLWGKGRPVDGSYSAGLAVDGSAVVSLIKGNGSSPVIKRGTQSVHSSKAVYHVGVNDVFGIAVSKTVNLGCKVINVTSTTYDALFRGVKVSCWRATTSSPLPSSWGISLSSKFAGVFKFDAHGNVSNTGELKKQP